MSNGLSHFAVGLVFYVDIDSTVSVFILVYIVFRLFQQSRFTQLTPAVNNVNAQTRFYCFKLFFSADKQFGGHRIGRLPYIRLIIPERSDQREKHPVIVSLVEVANEIHHHNTIKYSNKFVTQFVFGFPCQTSPFTYRKSVIQKNERMFGVADFLHNANQLVSVVDTGHTHDSKSIGCRTGSESRNRMRIFPDWLCIDKIVFVSGFTDGDSRLGINLSNLKAKQSQKIFESFRAQITPPGKPFFGKVARLLRFFVITVTSFGGQYRETGLMTRNGSIVILIIEKKIVQKIFVKEGTVVFFLCPETSK